MKKQLKLTKKAKELTGAVQKLAKELNEFPDLPADKKKGYITVVIINGARALTFLIPQ